MLFVKTKYKLPKQGSTTSKQANSKSKQANTTSKKAKQVNSLDVSKSLTKSTSKSNSKERYAVNYRLNPKTLKKEYLNPKSAMSGKCIYPFKWKRKTYNYPECLSTIKIHSIFVEQN